MSVVNGQIANDTTFNTSFLSRLAPSSSTVSIISLLNNTAPSGAVVNNAQALLNKLIEGVGTTGEGDTAINNYGAPNYVVNGQHRKDAIIALDTQLKSTQDDLDLAEADITGLDTRINSLESLSMSIGGNKTFTGNVVVNGDFTVQGTTTYINSTDMAVVDKSILVNKDGNDASADTGAGIEVQRTSDNGAIHFDSTLTSKWKLGTFAAKYEVLVSGIAQTIAGIKTFTSEMGTQNIKPSADVTYDAGSLTNRFANVVGDIGSFTSQVGLRDTAGLPVYNIFIATVNGLLGTWLRSHFTNGTYPYFGIFGRNSSAADAVPTDTLVLGTGNKTAGTGNSGSVWAKIGTSLGGTRGYFRIDDGSAVVGYVPVAQNTSGDVRFQALPAAGEVNTASNVGTGAGVFRDKTGVNLNLRKIKAGTNVTVTENADDIEIASTGAGSPLWVTQSKNANYNILNTDDFIFADASGGAFTLTFPSAATNAGKVLGCKKTDTSFNAVTLSGTGITTNKLMTTGEIARYVSDGATWLQIERKTELAAGVMTFTGSGSWVTNVTYNAKIVGREGQWIIIDYSLAINGIPTAANLNFNIPSAWTIDTAKFQSIANFRSHLGEGDYIDAGNQFYRVSARYLNTVAVGLFAWATSSTYLVPVTVDNVNPFIPLGGDYLNITFKVPITDFEA